MAAPETPITFAAGDGSPDREFASLAACARYIVSLRAKAPLVEGEPPCLKTVEGILERDALPGGRMLSVRLQDGAHRGFGTLLGFVLVARRPGDSAHTLMDAIIIAQAEREAPKVVAFSQ